MDFRREFRYTVIIRSEYIMKVKKRQGGDADTEKPDVRQTSA